MARGTRRSSGAFSRSSNGSEVSADTTELVVQLGASRVTYDVSGLPDEARRSFLERVVHYVDSQALGIPKTRT